MDVTNYDIDYDDIYSLNFSADYRAAGGNGSYARTDWGTVFIHIPVCEGSNGAPFSDILFTVTRWIEYVEGYTKVISYSIYVITKGAMIKINGSVVRRLHLRCVVRRLRQIMCCQKINGGVVIRLLQIMCSQKTTANYV
jgi:hypothetical protein